jgi:hypothetical protein
MLVRTQILFPKDELLEYQEQAQLKNISLSELVRVGMRKVTLTKKRKKISGAKAMLQLAEWAKKHNITGPSDLGSNDEYLYGKLAPDYPLKKRK